jgi:hypothetical protein
MPFPRVLSKKGVEMSLFSKKPESDQIRIVNETPRNFGERAYGIAEAIHLMRKVPVEQNVELVVGVIRNTLESLNVHLADIIEDAASKEKALQQRIETLKNEIAEHEKQIDSRGQEIGRLQSELSETSTVKERLMMAQHAPAPTGPVHPPKRETTMPPIPPQLKVPTPTPPIRAIQALQAMDDPE